MRGVALFLFVQSVLTQYINVMNRTLNNYFRTKKNYGAIFIRLIIGFHLIYGVQDNVLHWDRMLEFENFLRAHGFPLPLVSAIVSVYAQLICGILFIVGAFVRTAALIMIVNFCIAITMVHMNDAYPQVFPALMMLSGSIFLLFHGAGKLAIGQNADK
jgi:putative oxidoreductase